ncbi:NAD(P)-dependent oxidoreductase [Variovorax rhizosphaerae]|uniref:NAD(P)-dependent oxidoreductase n=1 Tax=Variovorax rhizosphaerae TaxID=1836200 RepID=A0ABU8WMP0_9BURK
MQLAFIGLGTMGAGMALNLIKAGHDVAVHDLRKESATRHLDAGARWAATVAEAAAGAQVVFTSVPGPKEMRQVGATLLDALAPGSTWFDLSTNSPSVVREVHKGFAEKDIALLDAPVSGGPIGANAGKLAIYVGGDQAVFERYRSLLDVIGDQVLHVGDIGAGNVAKLVHNCASITMRMMIAEVFSLGVKGGMEPLALWHAVRQGAIGRSRTFDRIGDQYLQDKYEPASFALKLAHKDLTLALDLGRELDVPMKYAERAMEDFQAALDRGWGDRDSRSPMQLINERAGVQIKVSAEDVKKTMARA